MKRKIIFLLSLILIASVIIFSSCENTENHSDINTQSDLISVGVFNGNGASTVCVLETLEALKIDGGIEGQEISAAEILNGGLNDLDVIIFPGGSGSKEYNNLGLEAEKKVKQFVNQGKGLVGICAGGYILANTVGYPSLKMLKVSNIREHYNRGRGLIGFSLTEEGKNIFPELIDFDTAYVQYYDGPIYSEENISQLNVLGTITTDIATHQNDPHGVTPGKPAFLTQDYGKGKLFVSVGHPESTPGMRWIVPRMVRWVNNNELVKYSSNVVRPEINNKEILYFSDDINFEKNNFWNLFHENNDTIINAINNLHKIRSRPSIRWSIGLLRHTAWEVRYEAAKYLVETEYTFALPDLEAAVNNEQDELQKKELDNFYQKLKDIYHSNIN